MTTGPRMTGGVGGGRVLFCLIHFVFWRLYLFGTQRRMVQPLGELSDFVTFYIIKNILLWGLCYVKNEGIFPEKQEEQMKDF